MGGAELCTYASYEVYEGWVPSGAKRVVLVVGDSCQSCCVSCAKCQMQYLEDNGSSFV